MHDLLAVYVDGETKTGKGAAGKAMAAALQAAGYTVYYDIAGDFYRRYVAWVRIALGLNETDKLLTGPVLEASARKVYESGQAFERSEALGDLQRPAISKSVSVLAELPLVQQAGIDWWGMTLELANQAGAEVVVLDGRNPRQKVAEAIKTVDVPVRVMLDLFMTCNAEVAGLRVLRSRGLQEPNPEQLKTAAEEVEKRRTRDRNRPVHPFIIPPETIAYDLASMTARQVIELSWGKHMGIDLPVAIKLDNSHLAMDDMLSAVSGLAVAATDYVRNQ